MKKSRLPESSGSIPLFTLLAGFAALTILVLLAALPASCASMHRIGQKTSDGTTDAATSGTDLGSGDGTGSGPTLVQAIRPLGTRPAHLRTDPATPVPNQQAITQALWAPGIDHGYVPQGLTFTEGHILVSAYRSTSPAVSMGPCRVYRMAPDSGEITGFFDLPPACGHAGGLAYAGDGILILSDTRRLYRINLELALSNQHARNAITGTLLLEGALRGSFTAFVPPTAWPEIRQEHQPGNQPGSDPGSPPAGALGQPEGPGVFIGAWSVSASKARGYFLPLSLFDSHDGTTITEASARHSIPLAARAQGGAFAPDGSLWLSYSSHDFGRVQRVDPHSGQVLASHPLVSGTEDISFDELGRLWAVSEAGSLRWRSWRTSFPVVFRLDTTLLD